MGEGGESTDTKTVRQIVSVKVKYTNHKYNYLHNVKYVVKSTFRNLKSLILSSLIIEF